jgi:hypothetical protein
MRMPVCPITKHLVDMVRLGIDPFTRAEIDEIRRAEDYHDMTYIDENNRVRYLISRGLVDEDILDLLYSHGYISANQMAATINQTRRTDDNRSN